MEQVCLVRKCDIGKGFSVYGQDDFPPNHLTSVAGCVDCSVIGASNSVRNKFLNKIVFFII